MLTGRDVVIVSSIDWDWKWQGPQEIAVRLARHSNRVLYIENPGVRAPRPKDARRLLKRVVNIMRSLRSSIREVETGVVVCTPAVLPPFGSAVRRVFNKSLVRFSVGRAMRKLEVEDPIVFVCLPTDVAWMMARTVMSETSPLIYYAISDLIRMTDNPNAMRERERNLIAHADLVFTTYLPLVERYEVPGVELHLLPYGVDTERFSTEGRVRRPPGEGPVMGYVGGISQHLDVELINGLAERRPDWAFVLVGPLQDGGEGLVARPNVHAMGQLRHAELPAWIRGFDVCLIPYRRSAYTDTVFPVKLNEYLAAGRPVVSVDLPALVDYDEPGILWLCPPEIEAFIECIEDAHRCSRDEALIAERRRRALPHDWAARMEYISSLIDGAISLKSDVRTGDS